MARKIVKKIEKLVKNVLRIVFCCFFFHWLFFTKFENYYYYEAINSAKNHMEIKCGEVKLSLVEIENEFFNHIKNFSPELLRKLEKGKEKSTLKLEELELLWSEIKDLEKEESWWQLWGSKELREKKKEYDRELKRIKGEINDNFRKKIKKYKIDITKIGSQSRGMWYKDPVWFFLLEPLNWPNWWLRKGGGNRFLLVELIFKLVIVKLFWLWIGYSQLLEKIEKNWKKQENYYLSWEENQKIREKTNSLLFQSIVNVANFTLFNTILFFHPFAFDKTNQIFLKEIGLLGIALWVVIQFLFSLTQEFVRQQRILTKMEIREFLAKIWIPILFSNLFFYFFIFRFFSSGRTRANNIFIFCGTLIDALINIIKVLLLRLIFGKNSPAKNR